MTTDDPVVEAAERFAFHTKEATRAKQDLRRLLDGDSVRPSRPSASLNGSARRAATEAKASKAAEGDQQVMDLLREKPMKQAELARALSLPPSSIGNKLARLRRKGLALPGEAGRWSPALSPTSADHGSAISANTA